MQLFVTCDLTWLFVQQLKFQHKLFAYATMLQLLPTSSIMSLSILDVCYLWSIGQGTQYLMPKIVILLNFFWRW